MKQQRPKVRPSTGINVPGFRSPRVMAKDTTIKEVLRAMGAGLYLRDAGPSSCSGRDALIVPEKVQRKLALDSINYFLSKFIPGGMGFLSVLVFVRMVGYEEYGRYAVVFAIVMAAASGMAGWLSQGILRFQSQSLGTDATENFSQATSLGTAVSVIFGAIGLAIAVLLSGVQGGYSVLISMVLFAELLTYTVTMARFQAGLDSVKVLRFEAFRSVACFAVPVVIMVLSRSRAYRVLLFGIAVGYLLPLFSRLISLETPARSGRRWRAFPSPEQRKVLSNLWRFGWPVALWLLCQQGLLVSDRFFIQRFSGYSDAGIYASMYDVVVRCFSLLFMPVTLAVHPLVMDCWNAGNRRHALDAIRSGLKYQLLMFIPIGAVLVGIGPWASRTILGKPIHAAGQVVLPLALGGFLWQTCLLAHKPLEILCETKRMLLGMLIALTINVAGNWMLVPIYGYKVSAYLTVASSSAYLLSLFVLTPIGSLREALEAESGTGKDKSTLVTDECVTTLT